MPSREDVGVGGVPSATPRTEGVTVGSGGSCSNNGGKNNVGRICVIGAGVAGVAMATALEAYGLVDYVVYEKQQGLGGLWYSSYPGAAGMCVFMYKCVRRTYDTMVTWKMDHKYAMLSLSLGKTTHNRFSCGESLSFNLRPFICTVQTTAAQYEYPGKKYPDHIRNRKMPPAPTADEVKDYLNEWCMEHNVSCKEKFEFGVTVTKITQISSRNWTVESAKRGTETFGYVILCTGLFSNAPNMFNIPGLEAFAKSGGTVVHSSMWKSSDEFKRKRVLVIGNGKSAADAAVAAANMVKLENDSYNKTNTTPPPLQCIRKQNWYVPRFLLQFYWAFHSRYVVSLPRENVLLMHV
jgi:cation diffusion facilitator CzcD-associated flavoprotein CzcO